MKRISLFLMAALCLMPGARAQDAAVEERLNKLSAQIDTLVEGQETQRKRIEALEKQLSALQQQQDKPNASNATQEDLKQLAAKVREVDQKRQDDTELIVGKIEKLGKTLNSPSGSKPARPATTTTSPGDGGGATTPNEGFEHVVQPGQTLSAIVQAYKEKNIKVTVEQILKANPGLVPEKMKTGQKIFIPAPQQ